MCCQSDFAEFSRGLPWWEDEQSGQQTWAALSVCAVHVSIYLTWN